MKLLSFQKEALEKAKTFDRCAFYYGLGLGKTYIGAEKLMSYSNPHKFIVCQKSKVSDWVLHILQYYGTLIKVLNMRAPKQLAELNDLERSVPFVAVVNYDMLSKMDKAFKKYAGDMALLLDESSLIKNEKAKRTKIILNAVTSQICLLSGTPVGGKYEELYTQAKLLGWNITRKQFDDRYIVFEDKVVRGVPFPIKVVVGYKNVEELKRKLKEHGALFKTADEVVDLPAFIDTDINVKPPKSYTDMYKDGVAIVKTIGNNKTLDCYTTLTASTPLAKLSYLRQLSSVWCDNKHAAFKDLLESTEDRLLVFYNFWGEYLEIAKICEELKRPFSFVNGKGSDLTNYQVATNSVTAIQYQSGAMGLNLQRANKTIFYSPTESYELYEQARGRTRRMGQCQTCFYWHLISSDIERRIYKALALKQDYTLELFKNGA